MSGPSARAVGHVRVGQGEAQVQYAPSALAQRVRNMVLTPEGTIRSIRGACSYEPYRGGDQYSTSGTLPAGYELFDRISGFKDAPVIYGVHHAGLLAGKAPTLVVRAGSKMYMHAGWRRAWKVIYEGLTDEGRTGYPDMFVTINNTIVWTNGIDIPLVISHDGMVVPLGFNSRPGSPIVDGPESPDDAALNYANSGGYSWRGRIGTVGDYVDAHDGALLNGRWTYHTAWEDVHGNISPLSPASVEAVLSLQRANEDISRGNADYVLFSPTSSLEMIEYFGGIVRTARVDDLQRQFLVRSTGDAPEHAVASWLYRTPDSTRYPAVPRVIERFSGSVTFNYPDNIPDSRLGGEAPDCTPVPQLSIIISHGGALVGAKGPYVYRSEVGFPGTLPSKFVITPDPDGSKITALASHAGRLIAFTERAMIDITNPTAPPVVLARGVGCVAPRSVQSLPSGMLIWLSRDAFYGWMPDGSLTKVGDAIHQVLQTKVARGAMRSAVSVVDPVSREYRCAVTPSGERTNSLILAYDSVGWREYSYGYDIKSMCVTDDLRAYTLFAGGVDIATRLERNHRRGTGGLSAISGAVGVAATVPTTDITTRSGNPILLYDVMVMEHETSATPRPVIEYEYLSAWLRSDDTALRPFQVHNLYIGMVEEVNAPIDVEVFANGSYAADADSPRKVLAVAPGAIDLTGDLVMGAGKTHAKRLFWRRVAVGLQNVSTWSFRLKSETPMHLAAFAFQISTASAGDTLGRIPLGEDE